jgi:uncharacterized protein YjbJ (UPF0337 family)
MSYQMTNDDTSDEASEVLFDSVAGKAKEVAGALTGKHDLTKEGQLQRAEARTRREADSQNAIADAQTQQAAEELRQEKQQATEERRTASAESTKQHQAVQQTAAAECANAETAAQKQEHAGRARAGTEAMHDVRETVAEAQSIRSEATERHAQHDRERLARDADAEQRRAAELRAEANNSSKGTRP